MGPEVADSDADSEFDSLPEPSQPLTTVGLVHSATGDSRHHDVAFDYVFEQTRQLLGPQHSQFDIISTSIASTDFISRSDSLAGAEPNNSPIALMSRTLDGASERVNGRSQGSPSLRCARAKTKRSHSEMIDVPEGADSSSVKKKRINRSRTSDSIHMLPEDVGCTDDGDITRRTDAQIRLPGTEVTPNQSNPLDVVMPGHEPQHGTPATFLIPGHLTNEPGLAAREGGSRNMRSILYGAVSSDSGEGSVSRSLLGNYQSIDLDCGGANNKMDLLGNPFGVLSQTSHPEEMLEDDLARSMAGLEQKCRTIETLLATPSHEDANSDADNHLHVGSPGLHRTQIVPIENVESVNPASLSNLLIGALENGDPVKPEGMKSSRKVNSGKRVSSVSTEPGLPEPSKRDLAACVNSLPTTWNKSTRSPANDSSPAEQLINGPHSSEDALIGLPRDSYKPRPSRSRSKKINEDDMVEQSMTPREGDTAFAASFETTAMVDERALNPSGKAARKSKVKRAKTSAGFLKKTEQMLSEGEEDVVWLETEPIKVKLALPPEINWKREPKEDEAKPESGQDAGKGDDVEKTDTRDMDTAPQHDEGHIVSDEEKESYRPTIKLQRSNITVEIPAVDTTLAMKPPPKKRGRKKKEQPEMLVDPIEVTIDCVAHDQGQWDQDTTGTADEEAPHARIVLAVTDSNRQVYAKPPGPSISPRQHTINATTPSPIKDLHGPPHLQREQENTTAPPKSSTKRAAQHSPIAPHGGRVTYRVGLSKRAPIPPLLSRIDRTRIEAQRLAEGLAAAKRAAQRERMREGEDHDGGGGGGDGDGDGDGDAHVYMSE